MHMRVSKKMSCRNVKDVLCCGGDYPFASHAFANAHGHVWAFVSNVFRQSYLATNNLVTMFVDFTTTV